VDNELSGAVDTVDQVFKSILSKISPNPVYGAMTLVRILYLMPISAGVSAFGYFLTKTARCFFPAERTDWQGFQQEGLFSGSAANMAAESMIG